jgi:hypothetical protein
MTTMLNRLAQEETQARMDRAKERMQDSLKRIREADDCGDEERVSKKAMQ